MFKHPQFDHQRDDFNKCRDQEGWAWFWEMGLGKSKQIIDNAAFLYRLGKITGLLVIAPNGVHTNTLGQEMPAHCPDDLHWYGVTYYSGQAGTKKQKKLLDMLMQPAVDRLNVLVMSYDAICTKAGMTTATKFLATHPSMMVLDESSMIKTVRSARAKACHTLGKLAHYRRIADGTPVAEGPFDIYSQLLFIIPDYWKRHGLSSFFTFKAMFGKFRTQRAAQGHQYQQLLGYQNTEYLQRLISDVSSRFLKIDCLDLPEKMYCKLTFDLTDKQRDLYDNLRAELRTEIAEGVDMDAPSAIVRLLRLQQVASGYAVGQERPQLGGEVAPATQEDALARLHAILETMAVKKVTVDIMPPEENPRLQVLLAKLETVHHKAIINVRFTRDVELITAALGERCLRYDGQTSDKNREAAITAFRDPAGPQFLCVNVAALSRGVTLVIAKTVIYYTNSFNLIQRLQSEDRAHRIGQTESVQYIDIVANDTVDEHIVKTLRDKFDLAATITGDRLREWIQ